MKVILYMAISLNGFIARENGEEDFFSDKNWETFITLAKQTGNFIYGRKTYEAVMNWGEPYVKDIETIKTKIVISRNSIENLKADFIVAHSPQEAIEMLKKQGCTEVLLTGGATNNSTFAKQKLIDEVIFNIEPFILGKGKQVFTPDDFELKLELIGTKKITDKIIQVRYRVDSSLRSE